ncbi:hypothetical protein BX661DRAFT_180984 [Kickxella alabastrina]|uniref:uncharacterized protein n=1 Tax=Kickxella alabastrina TaxID=61397 RepID=UPI00221F65F3|nr:uncharacterized protein BX661DRAFT_180984 [Kickxella alabastrina]KAI7830041.1 hypothetical protein BX661DRAFT_180984 [Kickxella alabastrina]
MEEIPYMLVFITFCLHIFMFFLPDIILTDANFQPHHITPHAHHIKTRESTNHKTNKQQTTDTQHNLLYGFPERLKRKEG